MRRGPSAERVLDAALDLGDEIGWDNLVPHLVATRAKVPLAAVYAAYRDVDAMADAYFAGLFATLIAPRDKAFFRLAESERLAQRLEAWLDALLPRRKLALAMIKTKLHPPHAHHWVPLVFTLSRTVQAWRDGAGIADRGIKRAWREIADTAILLAVLARLAQDDTPHAAPTKRALRRLLAAAHRE